MTVEHDIEFFVSEPADAPALGQDPLEFRYFLHQPGSAKARADRDPNAPKNELLEDR